MKIIVVDDEKIALEGAIEAVESSNSGYEIYGFRSAEEALAFVERENNCYIAFLDIEMRGMNGITLAKKLKVLDSNINIIFTTGYGEYAGDAFSLHASGYVMKPVTEEKVRKELSDLRHPQVSSVQQKLHIVAFGKFEVFFGEEPLKFKYSKTKELLAYLIDQRGSMCTNG